MKHLVGSFVFLAACCGPSLADAPMQQGRSVALCSSHTPVCAYTRDGRASETNECQALRDQAARILPGACWDED